MSEREEEKKKAFAHINQVVDATPKLLRCTKWHECDTGLLEFILPEYGLLAWLINGQIGKIREELASRGIETEYPKPKP